MFILFYFILFSEFMCLQNKLTVRQRIDRCRRLARISPIGNDSRRSACVYRTVTSAGRNGHVREEWGSRAEKERSGHQIRTRCSKDSSVGEKLEKD